MASSVECFYLNPYCCIIIVMKCSCILLNIMFSNVFEMAGKIQIGDSGSRVVVSLFPIVTIPFCVGVPLKRQSTSLSKFYTTYLFA